MQSQRVSAIQDQHITSTKSSTVPSTIRSTIPAVATHSSPTSAPCIGTGHRIRNGNSSQDSVNRMASGSAKGPRVSVVLTTSSAVQENSSSVAAASNPPKIEKTDQKRSYVPEPPKRPLMSAAVQHSAGQSPPSSKKIFKPDPDAKFVGGDEASISGVERLMVSFPECGQVVIRELGKYPTYPKPNYNPHSCSMACKFVESDKGISEFIKVVHTPLIIPLLFGWFREIRGQKYGRSQHVHRKVVYIAPCGRPLTTTEKLHHYLLLVNSVLPITIFSYELDLDLTRRFVIMNNKVKKFDEDLAKGVLAPYAKIPVFNCFGDGLPDPFSYVKKNMKTSEVVRLMKANKVEERSEGCSCLGSCGVDCLCQQMLEDNLPCTFGRLHEKQRFVVECNDHCKCSMTCGNRTTSNTIPFPTMMYYYPHKGWGVRALSDIPRGSFMGFYYGQIIAEKEISEFQDKFLVALDFVKAKQNVDDSIKSTEQASGSQSFSGTTPTETVADEEELFNIDGRRFGNLSRFFNHSCAPNMFAQVIHRESFSSLIYNVGFFTSKNIVAGEEMTWDYGYKIGSVPQRSIQCLCGSDNCRVRML